MFNTSVINPKIREMIDELRPPLCYRLSLFIFLNIGELHDFKKQTHSKVHFIQKKKTCVKHCGGFRTWHRRLTTNGREKKIITKSPSPRSAKKSAGQFGCRLLRELLHCTGETAGYHGGLGGLGELSCGSSSGGMIE